MKNQITFLILFIVLCFSSLQAQVTQEWVARYNGTGNTYEFPRSLAVDGSGNVYVTGSSSDGKTFEDYATIKYNSSGVQQWVQIYNGPGNGLHFANSLAVDGSGNVYVTGYSNGDYATIKYNSSGSQLWIQRYVQGDAFSLAVDGSGNVYVTGLSNHGGFNNDFVTIKYNSSGDSLWVVRYNGQGNGNDVALSLAVDGSGNVYVTGSSDSGYATIKYNSSGVQQWVQRYRGPGNGYAQTYSLAVDGSGNVYVTGHSSGSGTGYDYATIKYNSSGVQQWIQRYNGPGNDNDDARSLAVDNSGNVYVTGFSAGSGTDYDYATIKYNSSGVQQWVQIYNGGAASSLAVDGSGNVYVTGTSYDSLTSSDYATIKYNSSGAQQWVQRYDGPGNYYDGARSLVVDGSGNVYVTGFSAGIGTGNDYATIKYSQDNPMPIELTSFTSIVNGRDVILNWTTASETNNSGFEIQRSIVNGQWSMVGNATGNGTTNSPKNYSFTDRGLNSGKYNYRLKQIDFNGNFEYFNLSNEVVIGVPDKFALSQNYPNPFNPVTYLEIGISKLGFVSLKIYDILGEEVATLVNDNLNPGTYKYNFDASAFSSGVYFYKLAVDGDVIDTKRMILLK